eukprot:12378081-Heterocapsa_arctica.AAC.1
MGSGSAPVPRAVGRGSRTPRLGSMQVGSCGVPTLIEGGRYGRAHVRLRERPSHRLRYAPEERHAAHPGRGDEGGVGADP